MWLPGVSDFALSPDGARLAVALTSRDTLAVRVYSLDSFILGRRGQRLTLAPAAPRTWRVSSSYQKHQHRWPETIGLYWAGSPTTLAYWIGPVNLTDSAFPVGLLNTTTAGGSLIKDSAVFPHRASGASARSSRRTAGGT
jgi:hypothetical protein